MEEPLIIDGGLAVDDRGSLRFFNTFSFEGIKRFYVVSNHKSEFIRAWHGHKNEGKYIFVAVGSAVVAAVKLDDWEKPSKDLPIYRHVLSAEKPAILYIPPGYANGSMTLTDDAKILFFSTSTLEESKNDDFRFDANYWDPWEIVLR